MAVKRMGRRGFFGLGALAALTPSLIFKGEKPKEIKPEECIMGFNSPNIQETVEAGVVIQNIPVEIGGKTYYLHAHKA